MYDILQDRHTEARTAAHVQISVLLNPWISNQLVLHGRLMRFKVHALALRGCCMQMPAGGGVQSAAPCMCAEVQIFGFNQFDYISTSGDTMATAGVHLDNIHSA